MLNSEAWRSKKKEMRTKEFEILLVEDNETDALLVEKILENNGLSKKLMTVTNGAEAMDFLFARGKYRKRNPSNLPKLILLDLNLPYVHGFQVLENIRRNKSTMDIPVVVLTVSSNPDDELRSIALGVNNYIVKSFTEDKFISAVKEIELYWYFFNKPPEAVWMN